MNRRDDQRSHARATVLLATLLVITLAALAGSAALFSADSEVTGAQSAGRRLQARTMALSGVQAVMAELASQRSALIDGTAPRLTARWDMYSEGGIRGVVRLREFAAQAGMTAQPEAAKIDISSTPLDALVKGGLLPASAAAKAAGAWGADGPSCVEDLLAVPGFTAAMLYGAIGVQGAGEIKGRLIDYVTVYSFDPDIQSGIGPQAGEQRGKPRISLAGGWNDALIKPITERFGADAVQTARETLKGGAKFKTLAELVGLFRSTGVPERQWGALLDAFTGSQDTHVRGRVDLSTAPAVVLESVPGISAAGAAQIVATRERLDAETRKSVAWPLTEGILSADEFQSAVDHLTTRCLQWRVCVESGYVGEKDDDSIPVRDGVVLEAVIDVSAMRPRVAFLRDVSVIDALLARVNTAGTAAAQREAEGADTSAADAQVDEPADSIDTDLKLRGIEMKGMDSKGLEMKGLEVKGLEVKGLELGGFAPATGLKSQNSEQSPEAVGGKQDATAAPAGDNAGGAASSGANVGASVGAGGGRDPRIGRWAGSGRGSKGRQ